MAASVNNILRDLPYGMEADGIDSSQWLISGKPTLLNTPWGLMLERAATDPRSGSGPLLFTTTHNASDGSFQSVAYAPARTISLDGPPTCSHTNFVQIMTGVIPPGSGDANRLSLQPIMVSRRDLEHWVAQSEKVKSLESRASGAVAALSAAVLILCLFSWLSSRAGVRDIVALGDRIDRLRTRKK